MVQVRQQKIVERREWDVSRDHSHYVVTTNTLQLLSFYVSEVDIDSSALLM